MLSAAEAREHELQEKLDDASQQAAKLSDEFETTVKQRQDLMTAMSQAEIQYNEERSWSNMRIAQLEVNKPYKLFTRLIL
jgi:hypothetical protein